MREIIAVCRSSKRARERVASVLDRYFWRIGDRTWRGRASNACLDRVARELRAEARRNTAVAIHEIRAARESRLPIVRIGSRSAFSAEGLAPVASHAGRALRWPPRPEKERAVLAILVLAVLFHDLGKAMRMFQQKLRRALANPNKPEADPVRHELFSAMVWDNLFGELPDAELIAALRALTPQGVDLACEAVVPLLVKIHSRPNQPIKFLFGERAGGIAYAVGMLILTHHRLPEGSSNHLGLLGLRHVRADATLAEQGLKIADGVRFWHDELWLSRLRRAADDLRQGFSAPGLDMVLRASLMFADHLGSAFKEPRDVIADHLANTLDGRPADPLDLHVRRVLERLPGTFDMLHRHRERYPALAEDEAPIDIIHPNPPSDQFVWQAIASQAARDLCSVREGGFFACLLAGTGTGKTRGAPTILAAAAFGDGSLERRYLRFSLLLGLRSLASQSAQDYVEDLGFSPNDVSVLIGQAPVAFSDKDGEATDGSENLIDLPRWLQVEQATGGVPSEGSPREADWLRRLSSDQDRRLPATLDLAIEKAAGRGIAARRLIATPVLVGTIDHLMGVASPANTRFLFQSVRVLTSDLIIDEIDQYEPEDIAAIARLIYQSAAGGRRVIVMSATLTEDVATTLHAAYHAGWRCHAVATGAADHVNVLCSGDAQDSCVTNADGADFTSVYRASRDRVLASLAARPPRRIGRILPSCDSWEDLVAQINAACDDLRAASTTVIDGMRVSIGFVRMTRVAHAAALAVQLPAGPRSGRLRLKLCLHSRFPRLHRAWIERELKLALTRKGEDPDAGLRNLCRREALIERARALGCAEIEIVVVASPVIETGNDLDFDWAIIDPISLRAVVQAAGRVWRHRPYCQSGPNVLILGRSPIAMAEGALAQPGVETLPHGDTEVARSSLSSFKLRLFAELAGDEGFIHVDAGAVLRPDGSAPLRAAEARLRQAMLDAGGEAPLGCYIRHATARLNLRMTRSRMFRRSTARNLLYVQHEGPKGVEWLLDLAPGTRQSALRPATPGLTLCGDEDKHLLFPSLATMAWMAYLPESERPTSEDLRRLMRAEVPEYSLTAAEPRMTYATWTGFTRGEPEDLYSPFGKK